MNIISNVLKTNGTLVLSDPVYQKNNGYNVTLDVKEGNWVCGYEKIDDRVSSITVIHEGYDFNETEKELSDTAFEDDELAVDSALMTISDESFFDMLNGNDELVDKLDNITVSYVENEEINEIENSDEYMKSVELMKSEVMEVINNFKLPISEEDIDKWLDSFENFLLFESNLFKNFKITVYDPKEVEEVFSIIIMVKDNDENIAKAFNIVFSNSMLTMWQKKCLLYEQYISGLLKDKINKYLGYVSTYVLKNKMHIQKTIPSLVADVYDNKCLTTISGWGDGFYPYAVVRNDDNQIIGITIVFMVEY